VHHHAAALFVSVARHFCASRDQQSATPSASSELTAFILLLLSLCAVPSPQAPAGQPPDVWRRLPDELRITNLSDDDYDDVAPEDDDERDGPSYV
jgi:hypothetical protein